MKKLRKKENCKLGHAVQIALNQVIGAYAIAVIDVEKPDEIIVARLGSPLAIGIGEEEFLLLLMQHLYRVYVKCYIFRR